MATLTQDFRNIFHDFYDIRRDEIRHATINPEAEVLFWEPTEEACHQQLEEAIANNAWAKVDLAKENAQRLAAEFARRGSLASANPSSMFSRVGQVKKPTKEESPVSAPQIKPKQ